MLLRNQLATKFSGESIFYLEFIDFSVLVKLLFLDQPPLNHYQVSKNQFQKDTEVILSTNPRTQCLLLLSLASMVIGKKVEIKKRTR